MIAAPATLTDLHRAIKARMAEVAAGLPLLSTKRQIAGPAANDHGIKNERAPQILEFDTPPKTTDGEQYPFIMVRPTAGTDSAPGGYQDAQATFDLVVGTWSDTDDGGTDVLIVIDRIRQSLGGLPTLADTAFEHTGPLTWTTENLGAVRPQWLGKVTTIWTLPRPRRVDGVNPAEV